MLNLLNLFFNVNSLNSVENYDKIYWNWWIFLFSSPVCWEMYEHCNEKLHVDYHSSLLLVVWANEWSLGSLGWLVRLQSIVWRRHDIQNEAVCGVVQVGASGSCFRTSLMRYFLVLSSITPHFIYCNYTDKDMCASRVFLVRQWTASFLALPEYVVRGFYPVITGIVLYSVKVGYIFIFF